MEGTESELQYLALRSDGRKTGRPGRWCMWIDRTERIAENIRIVRFDRRQRTVPQGAQDRLGKRNAIPFCYGMTASTAAT